MNEPITLESLAALVRRLREAQKRYDQTGWHADLMTANVYALNVDEALAALDAQDAAAGGEEKPT